MMRKHVIDHDAWRDRKGGSGMTEGRPLDPRENACLQRRGLVWWAHISDHKTIEQTNLTSARVDNGFCEHHTGVGCRARGIALAHSDNPTASLMRASGGLTPDGETMRTDSVSKAQVRASSEGCFPREATSRCLSWPRCELNMQCAVLHSQSQPLVSLCASKGKGYF